MNISIVGAGHIAETMARTINMMEGAQVYAVASRSLDKAEEFAKKFGIPKAYGSYAELADDPDAGLVYIATPHSFHYEQSMMFIKKSHPVMCEKSFTVNAAQAEELFKTAQENNVFITEALWTRFMPIVDKVKEFMGKIGEIKLLESNFCVNIIGKERMHDPNLAGGALLDLGIYTITAAFLLFGSDYCGFETNAVMTDKGVDAQSVTTLMYPDGKRAVLISAMDVKSDCRTRVSGSEGYVEIDGASSWHCARLYDGSGTLVEEYTPQNLTGYEYEVRSAIKAIEEGKKECSEITHEETMRAMRLMDGMRDKWGMKYPFEK